MARDFSWHPSFSPQAGLHASPLKIDTCVILERGFKINSLGLLGSLKGSPSLSSQACGVVGTERVRGDLEVSETEEGPDSESETSAATPSGLELGSQGLHKKGGQSMSGGAVPKAFASTGDLPPLAIGTIGRQPLRISDAIRTWSRSWDKVSSLAYRFVCDTFAWCPCSMIQCSGRSSDRPAWIKEDLQLCTVIVCNSGPE